MKASGLLIGSIVVGLAMVSCEKGDSAEKFDGKLDVESKKFSYALGMEIGTSLKKIGTDVDFAAFYAGAKASLLGETTLMSDSEAADVKGVVFRRIQEEKKVEAEAESKVAMEAEKVFFEANKAKEGVISLPSGLQYLVVSEGKGPKPKATDKIKMNYKGTLLDGTEFDNSKNQGVPAEFAVGQIIPGMSEGLQLMNVGGSYKMWIPSALAYGPRQMSEKIKPNSTLIFEVELLEIVK